MHNIVLYNKSLELKFYKQILFFLRGGAHNNNTVKTLLQYCTRWATHAPDRPLCVHLNYITLDVAVYSCVLNDVQRVSGPR